MSGATPSSGRTNRAAGAAAHAEYAELAVTTNFTFLCGASHPEEYVSRAAELGYRAISIADTNTLAGIVRAHVAAREVGIPIAIGSRLVLNDPPGLTLIAYPTNRPAYAHLCQLLTRGKRRAAKGECDLTLRDVAEGQKDLLAIVVPPRKHVDRFASVLPRLRDMFDDDRLSLALHRHYEADDAARLDSIASLARSKRVPIVAINDVRYHAPERRALQDVVTCIRRGCTIEEAGFALYANAERHLKPADEMARLFVEYPEALARTIEIAERASAFSLDELRYEYPVEPCPPGSSPTAYLRERVETEARVRYPDGVPAKTRELLDHELRLIDELGYEAYFLTCYDIVKYARSKGMLCQGRGGAANSAVCYCLGITEVDPARFQLLFERFVSRERNEPPDIDIDFEHERREEVIQYLYDKYGRDRAALTAEVITYRARSAVREVGKAMGLSLDRVDILAKNLDRWREGAIDDRLREIGMNPDSPVLRRVVELTMQLVGFPRHLSQHVGGFVITRTPLSELVPIENAAMENRTVIEWDKDDIDAMGMLKVDCLGLGMLTCIRKTFGLLRDAAGRDLSIPRVMAREREDDTVYEMIQHADTVGVFQIESRAQMSMLPRLKPREFYDLVIEVAIVRPGPIQGGMVHPYLRRRAGEEPVWSPKPEVKEVLGRTLGVPIFQEQAMRLAIVAGGFSPDEADALRRAMAAWRRKGDQVARFGDKLIDGMIRNGYPREFAERCFEQIKGFSEYGFPESHAASFAILAYVSCWLKRFEPAAFAAALLNSQPMGFYQPAQIIRDARAHGVEARPIDVNDSAWDCTLERTSNSTPPQPARAEDPPREWGRSGPAIRLGMRLVKGLSERDASRIYDAVTQHGPFRDIESLWRASGARVEGLRCLARADAFRSMGIDHRTALWHIRPLRNESLPLFEQSNFVDSEGITTLPEMPFDREVYQDYEATGLSLKAHPMSFVRRSLKRESVVPAIRIRSAKRFPRNTRVKVAGLVLMRQRPSTASGVVFITLEDETGIVNLILWRDTFEKYRRIARLSRAMIAHGRIERQGEVVHVHADHLENLDDRLDLRRRMSRDFH